MLPKIRYENTVMIPHLPEPPTDNLYKFMAIAGLVMFAASIIIPYHWLDATEDQLANTQEQFEVLNTEKQSFQRKLDIVSEIISNSILSQKGKFTESPDKLHLTYSNDELKALTTETLDIYATWQVNVDHANAADRRLSYLIQRTKLIGRMAWLFMILSAIITTLGFSLWYVRIQIHIDRTIQNSKTPT